ncbi:MAG: hypothetical protein NTU97_00335 [Candidatus Magasanikbacteria bacterium]|nr:hypothetical protein [Candidatus Magasanikbacteria bacterium]
MSFGFWERNFKIILGLTIVGLAFLAFFHRFFQDDAYISLRYADNLVRGWGLVWKKGERVEGYTNFLWTLLLSIPLYFKINPIHFSWGLGIIFFILNLFFTFKLSLLVLKFRWVSYLTVLFLGLNFTFSSYATGGLETSLQSFLFTLCSYLFLRMFVSRNWSFSDLLTLSFFSALAVLTRLDSLILVAVLFLISIVSLIKKSDESKKIFKLSCLLLPFLLLVGFWLAWKVFYYGDILPNTFYAKVSLTTSWVRGLFYLYAFSVYYWLLIFPFLAILFIKKIRKDSNLLVILSIVFLWLLYIIKVGGDFMEFRFLVPILPLIFIFIFWIIQNLFKANFTYPTLIILAVFGAWGFFFPFSYINEIESVADLQGHLKKPEENWEQVGKVLGDNFFLDPNMVIAVAPAGAIPYFSHLKTVDMLGLNDRWIAKEGFNVSERPGHQKIATLEYLLNKKVNLVIGHPSLQKNTKKYLRDYSLKNLNNFFIFPVKSRDQLVGKKIINIPINSEYKLPVLYLTPSDFIDQAIKKNNWEIDDLY